MTEFNYNKILSEAQIMNERLLHTDLNFSHKSYQTELSLYELVSSGDIDGLRKRSPSLRKKGLGKLSSNDLRNTLFHLIINTANCARYCIDTGMDLETAYTISDLYIQKADLATTIEQLEDINYHMMFDYTNRMKQRSTQKKYTPEINKAVEYIDANLHRTLYASEVAEYLKISTSGFSRRFYASVGMKFNPYIEMRRIQLSKRYLRYTDISIAEIASNLAFCSQSYFNTRFKQNVGITPLQYRKATEDESEIS